MNKDLIRKSLIIPQNIKQILLGSENIPQEAQDLVEKFLEKYSYYDEKISDVINESGNSIILEYINKKEQESLQEDIVELEKIATKLDNL